MKHENRIPAPGQEGRMRITPEEGMAPFYAKLEMADNPSVDGTAWEKPVMDEFLAALGTTAGTATALTLEQPGFVLTDGALVRFKNHVALSGFTGATTTLNVENTGAAQLQLSGASTVFYIPANTWIDATYSATRNIYTLSAHSGILHSAVGVGTLFSGSQYTATLTNAQGWRQLDGVIVAITFTSAVAANATINVNAQGFSSMRVGGANITAGVIPAGATATLMRSGTYWLVLAVDSKLKEAKPFIAMTYTGDGASTRTITTTDANGVAFTPSAVLVLRTGAYTYNSGLYGGLAITGYPASFGTPTSVTITTSGFIVYYSTSPAAYSNESGVRYHVLAFKP